MKVEGNEEMNPENVSTYSSRPRHRKDLVQDVIKALGCLEKDLLTDMGAKGEDITFVMDTLKSFKLMKRRVQ